MKMVNIFMISMIPLRAKITIIMQIMIISMIMIIRSLAGLLIIDITISSLDINQCDGPRHQEGGYQNCDCTL